jgi:PAS domain S-box-containing protein
MKDLILTSKEDVGEISVSKAETIGSGNAFRWETAYRELGHLQSAKKQKAELLRESDDKYLRLVETTTDWVWATDLEGCYTYSNPSIYPLLGYRVGEVTGAGTLPPMYLDDEQHARQMIKHCIEQKVGWKNFNIRRVHKDGSIRSFESTASPIVNTAGQVEGFSGIDRDITERKRMEAALQAANDELEQRVANRTDELERVNDELRTEIMERKRMEAALQAAHDELEQRMADRTDELERVNDELRTEITERKRMEAALQAAHDELEKRVSDRTDELARVADEFRTEIAKREKVEEQLQYTLDSFQKTVGMTLQVMGSTVEIKDPYTAGHQTRSATIARNIARMMGLSRDQINIVRMASSIHDIGKLSIPVEILSKPGKLSEIEFPLIREHAKRGYEILKEIEFPWPLAEIIHQHHERMDGSGYPRNLKGDEICVEARIMAVADVVEAMASPRPYRPALGIEAALEEIERNRGTLYDNTVADACLQLFRDNGFQIAEV